MLGNNQNNSKEKAKRDLEVIRLFKDVFETEKGKKVIEVLKNDYFYNKTTTVIGHPELSNVNEGQRCVVIDILSLVDASKELVIELEQTIEKGETQA